MLKLINSFQSYFTSHVLLYHSTYSSVPINIKSDLHNVYPETIYKQIAWLKKYFDFVEIDQLFNQKLDDTGKVAITFDDAYQSVFTEAFPVIKSLNVPCSIFINGTTLSGKMFWRDKIRIIINNSLIEHFLDLQPEFCTSNNINSSLSKLYI